MGASETLDKMYGNKVLVFGHRGAMAHAPMNTIPSFELARQQGADAVELDVQLSKDGELVVVHDFTVDETTDGTGTVADMTLDELKSLDAGSWFDAKFAGTRIPTLSEVFTAVGDKLYINVEIKHITAEDTGIEQAVADCIERYSMKRRVIVSCFNPLVLKRFRTIMPDVPLGYLQSPETMAGKTQALMGSNEYEARHLYRSMVNAAQMEFAAEYKHRVNVWTVNDPDLAKSLVEQGVHGIMTDDPAAIVKALAE